MQELGSCQELGRVDAHRPHTTKRTPRRGAAQGMPRYPTASQGIPRHRKVSHGIARYRKVSHGIARYPNASHQCSTPATDAPSRLRRQAVYAIGAAVSMRQYRRGSIGAAEPQAQIQTQTQTQNQSPPAMHGTGTSSTAHPFIELRTRSVFSALHIGTVLPVKTYI
jgi:hypothetical protein